MRVVAVVAVVLVVLLTGLPLGMAMADCPACLSQNPGGLLACTGVLAAQMMLLLLPGRPRRRTFRPRVPLPAFVPALEHPPRL